MIINFLFYVRFFNNNKQSNKTIIKIKILKTRLINQNLKIITLTLLDFI